MAKTSDIKPFGSYGFTETQKKLLWPVKWGISRNFIREFIEYLWSKTCAPDALFDIEYQGVKLRLCPFINMIDRKILLNAKIRDKKEIQHLLQMPADGVFVDIGANIGYYSLMVAHGLPKAKIIAFEPSPKMHEMFCTNIALNNFDKSIKPMQMAVGGETGTALLSFSTKEHALGSLNSDIYADRVEDQCEVPVMTLKDALQKVGVQKINALKIDIEGYEDKALLPYFRTTDKKYWPDKILIEICRTFGWEEDVIKFMTDNGYRKIAATRANGVFVLQ